MTLQEVADAKKWEWPFCGIDECREYKGKFTHSLTENVPEPYATAIKMTLDQFCYEHAKLIMMKGKHQAQMEGNAE